LTKLNDKQTAILANAAERADGSVLPLPQDMPLKGGALTATLQALERRGLAEHSADDVWILTEAGRAAVGTAATEAGDRDDENAAPQAATADPNAGDNHDAAKPLFRSGTRQAQLLDLLQRDEGADIDEMVQFTGWQPHSVRAVLTGFRKRGIEVSRTKEGNGVSVYRATLPANADAMAY
jgi:DNA-binding MarR family transcriptional regulator